MQYKVLERFVIGYVDKDGSLRLYVPQGHPISEHYRTTDLDSAQTMAQIFERGETQDIATKRPEKSRTKWRVYREKFELVQ